MSKVASAHGEVFEAAMKALKDLGKPQGRMQTWYCDECTAKLGKHTFHNMKGRAGCAACAHYETRVEEDSK